MTADLIEFRDGGALVRDAFGLREAEPTSAPPPQARCRLLGELAAHLGAGLVHGHLAGEDLLAELLPHLLEALVDRLVHVLVLGGGLGDRGDGSRRRRGRLRGSMLLPMPAVGGTPLRSPAGLRAAAGAVQVHGADLGELAGQVLVHLHEGVPGAFLLHHRVVQSASGRPARTGTRRDRTSCATGTGDWCPAASGGRSKLCAFGAVVATCGLEFGPSCAGDDASCPSVMSGRLYLPGRDHPRCRR